MSRLLWFLVGGAATTAWIRAQNDGCVVCAEPERLDTRQLFGFGDPMSDRCLAQTSTEFLATAQAEAAEVESRLVKDEAVVFDSSGAVFLK